MTQTRIGALAALEAVIKAAVEAAGKTFVRDEEPDATRDGVVVMTDGNPGEPEVLLSPRRYCWLHKVEFEIAAKGKNRKTVVEDIIKLFEPALAADRTLDGAVDGVSIEDPPDGADYDVDGAETEYSAVVKITADYTTDSAAG
jgi:hypothetical protein